ncbi:flagellar M-ring protein [bacterium BMS3Abin04]|nr:flagellar M-ring protein [bacterium BMS3Abin04]
MDKSKNLYGSLLGIFNKLSLQQRLMLAGIAVVTFVLLGFILFVFNEPTYSTLYSNLSQEDASQVVNYLSAEKIAYKIVGNGTTITIPKDKIYKVRLDLASKGVPNSGVVGYEIFDHNTMGMSEFMQRINYKRALEGELARTISEQDGIKSVRVHIVIPTKSIFKDEEKQPTASVVLKLASRNTPSRSNITAIENLVAGSVEGLTPGNVTIVDTRGQMLSKPIDQDPLASSGSKQYEIKTNIEKYLTKKAQRILNKIVGYGNSDIQVNVDLNFKQVEKTMETYDPESQVVVSEQTSKSQSNGVTTSDSSALVSENTTTNYEISKTIEKMIDGAGNIERITLAAVINGVPKEVKNGSKVETVYEPRTDAQLKKIEQLLRQAVGINDSRKDKITIVSIPFETPAEVQDDGTASPLDDIGKWINYLLMILAIAGAGFVLKSLMKKLKDEKIMIGTGTPSYEDQAFSSLATATAGNPAGLPPSTFQPKLQKKKQFLEIGDIEDEITDEAAHRQMKQEKIVNYVAKNPTEAAKLINSWLREDEYE